MSKNAKNLNNSLEMLSKNILQTKSNQVNTLQKLNNNDAELVQKLNFFNSYVEITENNKKQTNSLYSLKLPPQQLGIRRQESADSITLPYISLRKSTNKSINQQDVFDNGKENILERNSYLRRLENLANENKLEMAKRNIIEKINNFKQERKTNTKHNISLQEEINERNIQIEFLENFEKYGNKYPDNMILKNIEFSKNFKHRNSEEENLYFLYISKVKRDSQKREQKVIDLKEEIKKFSEKKIGLANKNIEIKKQIDELKKQLAEIKHKLLLHYHILLKEGKDTRHEGLIWLIKAIWNLDENVILSNCPNYLDEKAIDYLFTTAKKEIELQYVKNEIDEWKLKMRSYLKNPAQIRFSVFKTNIRNAGTHFKKVEKMHKNKNFLELYEKQSTRNLININLKKLEEVFSSKNILNDQLKYFLFKLKDMEKNYEDEKSQIAIKRKNELNRIGREFLLNDYKRRFNTDIRTVISAIAGEDSVNYEILKLERDKKDFLDKIKMCRNYNALDSNIIKSE